MVKIYTPFQVVTWCLRAYIGLKPYMVNVYIKERINDQTTICAGGVTSNIPYLGLFKPKPLKSLPRCTYEGGSNPPSPRWSSLLKCLMAIEINKLLKMSLRESSLEVHFTDNTLRGLLLKYLNLRSEKAALVKAVQCSLCVATPNW